MDDSLHKKYWEAETSLEEEERLLREMAGTPGPEAAYFAMIAEARRQKSRLTIGDIQTYTRHRPQAGPVTATVIPLYRKLAAAAAILVVIAAGFGLWQYNQKASAPAWMAETYDNPHEAYEEVRQALAFVSTKLNRSQTEALTNIKKAGEYADIFK